MGSVSPQHSCASPKLAKYLERNRIAANKFRERKKKKDKQIERRCSDATKKNEVLLAELSYLREQVCKLKNIVFPHAECADHQNGLQLATMTQIVLDSHRKHDPSTWSTLSSEAWLEESVATDGESYTMIEPSRILATDIEILKSEVDDLKQMVIAQQPSLPERRKRKRVSFQEDVS
ncbi:hypothetical protein PENANT_c151G08761 [Penicillium antarcticum]|uniref:BZIP domain-containing protein n=1 Tax=Penicillium antarcticum TaxID=416450 RepID=A0A1V6PEP5_9EURO|nr:hypothetical protein PENANT_c151G08761 [Penicillium antarcticum]